MYELGALLATLSLALAARLARKGWDRRVAVAWVAVTSAALWTLYLLAFLLVVVGAWWLWSLRERAGWRARLAGFGRYATLELAALALVFPWLAFAIPRMRSWSVQEPFDGAAFGSLYGTLLTLGVSTNIEQWRWLVVALLVPLVVGLVMATRSATRSGSMLLPALAVAVPPLVVWAVTTIPRVFGYSPKPEARYLLPYAPAFFLLAAWAGWGLVGSLRPRWRLPVAVLLLVAVTGVQAGSLADYYSHRYLADDYKSATLTLRAQAREGDLVLLHSDQDWPVFAYHWPGEFKGTPHLQDATASGVEHFLAPLWEGHGAIWLVVNEDSLRVDPSRLYEGWLAQHAAGTKSWRFGDRKLVAFARTNDRAASLSDVSPQSMARLASVVGSSGDGILGSEQAIIRQRPGEASYLAVYVERTSRERTVKATLDDSSLGAAAATMPPGAGVERVTLGLVVPPGAAAGWYQWIVEVDGQRTIAGRLDVIAPPPSGSAEDTPNPTVMVGKSFGQLPVVTLVGYDLEETDTRLELTLYWRAETPLPSSYKAFVHVVADSGPPLAQSDSVPADGSRPTTTWRPGDVIVDRHVVDISTVPRGMEHPLAVGLYDPVTGERMTPNSDTGNTPTTAGMITLTSIQR